ncbi:hypothetical protein M9Y10_039854 [Tritrichomonas musculus]|uniref:Myb-like DNA-binding domain containing protein n=1 Tax=Tritrichomonas musculus TaxID=1915356 RepID=A0ABR2GS53_9EUKA
MQISFSPVNACFNQSNVTKNAYHQPKSKLVMPKLYPGGNVSPLSKTFSYDISINPHSYQMKSSNKKKTYELSKPLKPKELAYIQKQLDNNLRKKGINTNNSNNLMMLTKFAKRKNNISRTSPLNGFMLLNMDSQPQACCFATKSRVPFSVEEDEKIKSLVNQYGTRQWQLVASFMDGRTPKQCRDRYSNYLVPGYFKGEWSNEEDELLTRLFSQFGPKWSIIQKSFPGRSPNSVKNRWKFFLCRQENIESSPIPNDSEIKDESSQYDYDASDGVEPLNPIELYSIKNLIHP